MILPPAEAEDDKESKAKRDLVEARVNTSSLVKDWLLDARTLVAESNELLGAASVGFYDIWNAVESAAGGLEEHLWKKFCVLPVQRFHIKDREVYTTFFGGVEPSWRTLLMLPKQGSVCMFLHIGNTPMSVTLAKLLIDIGWYGIAVGPTTPPADYVKEEFIQWVRLDPGSPLDEEEVRRLWLEGARGGQVPRPKVFNLVFVDIVLESENDSDMPAPKHDPEEYLMPGELYADLEKDPIVPSIPLPGSATGYGMLGITRSSGVRRRLRMFQSCLATALQRLAAGGTLVVTWPGMPTHPVFLFIVCNLRPVFLRLHTLVMPGKETWEVYILCAGFKREEAEQAATMAGSGGYSFRNFLMYTGQRRMGLDDALLWTLSPDALSEEYRLGNGDKSRSKGYNDLWKTYALKMKDLVKELGGAGYEIEKKEKKGKGKGKGKSNGGGTGIKAGGGKAKEKVKAKDAEEPAVPAPAPAPVLPPIAPVAKAKPVVKKKPLRPPMTRVVVGADGQEKVEARLPTKYHLTSRSMPSLSCTFGAAPGSKWRTRDPRNMCKLDPMFSVAYKLAEIGGRTQDDNVAKFSGEPSHEEDRTLKAAASAAAL